MKKQKTETTWLELTKGEAKLLLEILKGCDGPIRIPVCNRPKPEAK